MAVHFELKGNAMGISRESFGQTGDGQAVDAFILDNGSVKAKIINYGATIVSIEAPDREGNRADVVLGFDDMAGYQSAENPYFGACCGRVANRIAGGRFSIDGVPYEVAQNQPPNALHGGNIGFDKKVWKAVIEGEAVRMKLVSPDGDEGYPGTLSVEILYSLSSDHELRIDYSATTDKKTILNLTNHSYFNLAGGGSVYDQVICVNADRYAVTDDTSIPTGELRPVTGTVMDLLKPTPFGENINRITDDIGYDHNYCLNQEAEGELTLAAVVTDPASGRRLECLTTEPGVQLYTGNYLDGIRGKGGAVYNKHEAFCLETQHFPDSQNHPEFPGTELAPRETYLQTSIYRFGVME